MVSIKDVESQALIMRLAEKMEKMEEFRPPAWSSFVKTGRDKQRTPSQANWWWIRSASALRKVYLKQGVGVSRLRKEYGGRKNRGHKPEHKYKASGSVVRKVLQQLETAGFVKTDKKKGRVITNKGEAFLRSGAKQ